MAYNLLNPVSLIVNGDASANIISDVIEIKQQDNVGMQLKWDGTVAGTFDFQVSMDYAEDINGNVTNPGNWITLTLSPPIVAVGAPDDAYVDFNQLSAPYMRVVFTNVAGAGILNCLVVGKAV